MARKAVWILVVAMVLSVCAFAHAEVSGAVAMTLQDFVNEARACLGEGRELSPEQANQKIAATPNMVIIDVNEQHEFNQAHLKNALLIPRGFIEFKITKNDLFPDINKGITPAQDTPMLLTCKLGARSLMAAATLKKMGYTEVYCVKGGLDGWKNAKLPLEVGAKK
ncbi:MAG: rhodanese-like domain-containing protein [Candidatus Omnitrophota bacterium]